VDGGGDCGEGEVLSSEGFVEVGYLALELLGVQREGGFG